MKTENMNDNAEHSSANRASSETTNSTDDPNYLVVYEDKAWLYEHYWGNFESTRTLAEHADCDRRTICKAMKRHGIPRRPQFYDGPDSDVSPFIGFY